MWRTWASISRLVGCSSAVLISAMVASASQPHIFYSDLDSGPNSGGEKSGGAYVTIYGRGFGATQGTSYVSVGGGRLSVYPTWSDSKISFQLNAAAASGDIVVTTAQSASNGVSFAVRPGKIYFVSPAGSNSSGGGVSSPWKTVLKARDSMAAGDITYLRNGVAQSTDDGNGWNACLSFGGKQGGAAGRPKALVGYPGETATIGNPNASGCGFGIRNRDGGESYYTFANLTLRGGGIAIAAGGGVNWRVIGNDISCPNGNDQAGCVDIASFSYAYFYGNNIHHVATNSSPNKVTALYHGVYVSEQNDHIYFGWNTIAYIQGCRGFQQNINQGNDVYDLHVHDNVIHDTQCDGILADAMDPSKGPVEFYNNVIYNTGTGPNNAEGSGSWTCMTLWGGEARGGAKGSGTIDVYNNTMYNCGGFTNPPYADSSAGFMWQDQSSSSKHVSFRNNIVYMTAKRPYLIVYSLAGGLCNSNCAQIQGSNNLFYGNGGPPKNAAVTKSINSDPLFANPAQNDFHLQPSSPARQGGIDAGLTSDFDGNARGGSFGFSIGAFQYANGLIASMACSPAALVTPGSIACDVTLALASDGDLQLTLSADTPGIQIPASVLIPAGSTSASLTLAAAEIASRVDANLAADAGGGSVGTSVWLLPPGDSAPLVLRVVNAASFLADGVSPGAVLTAFGLNLGPSTPVAYTIDSNGLPNTIQGVQCLIDKVPAPLMYVSSSQVTFLATSDLNPGSVAFEVQNGGGGSNEVELPVSLATPGIFVADASGSGPAAAVNQDGSLNSAAHPASRQSIIAFYVSGLGATPVADSFSAGADSLTAPLSVNIGGVDSVVVDANLVTVMIPGIYQILAQVPQDAASGDAALLLTAGDIRSQPGVTISVQ